MFQILGTNRTFWSLFSLHPALLLWEVLQALIGWLTRSKGAASAVNAYDLKYNQCNHVLQPYLNQMISARSTCHRNMLLSCNRTPYTFFVAPKLHKFQNLRELYPRSITAQQHPPSNLSSVTVGQVESWPKREGRSTPLQAAVLTLAIFLGLTASEDEMWISRCYFKPQYYCEIVRTYSTPSQIMTWNWQMNITHSTSTITCI